MSDVFRRLVARTLAQQLAPEFDSSCAPFQYALSTRAGTEALARTLQATTESDPLATIVSIDGMSAYDHVSRRSMLAGLRRSPALAEALPFVRQFYGVASTYLWEDANGHAHEVGQAEGGEQGDPLMPGLFALGLHPALVALRARLRPGEALYAYLDDVYLVCRPERARELFDAARDCLWEHARIRV